MAFNLKKLLGVFKTKRASAEPRKRASEDVFRDLVEGRGVGASEAKAKVVQGAKEWDRKNPPVKQPEKVEKEDFLITEERKRYKRFAMLGGRK